MKNKRARLFLALAALCGLATATTARNVLQKQVVPIETLSVVVATEALAPGGPVGAAQVKIVQWPRTLAPSSALSSSSELQGRVLARPVAPGEPLLRTAFLPEGREAGLDGLIAENKRAISVKIDEFVGVGGFLQPGARVDVLATRRETSGSGEARSSESKTTVVLENILVLAVDRRVVRTDGSAEEEVHVATLEVGSDQVSALAHAEHEGRLKLALRGQGDEDKGTPPVRMVLGTDVKEVRF